MTSFDQPVSPVDADRTIASAIAFVAAIVIVGILIFMGKLVLDHFRDPGRFPIRSVVVEGVYEHIDHDMLRHRVMAQAERGFFNLDISRIQQEVEGLQWVDKAYVRRVWPESISVHLEEHKAVARWGDSGLVSNNFKLFFPAKSDTTTGTSVNAYLDQLPMLYSPERRHVALLKLLMETEPLLEKVEAPLTGISEDERRSVTLTLKNNVKVIIGHRLISERINRFADIFRSYVAPVYDDVVKVDMRYTNGFAMARKSSSANSARVD
ncbi:hypothetical protein AB833_11505 [Chromatiales bacterium (ex Bugula neritina AB1)]|nr:hypothetical protein AB833_11505 [Chromatiales bacterium (ex Bugula neritina AB1)]